MHFSHQIFAMLQLREVRLRRIFEFVGIFVCIWMCDSPSMLFVPMGSTHKRLVQATFKFFFKFSASTKRGNSSSRHFWQSTQLHFSLEYIMTVNS